MSAFLSSLFIGVAVGGGIYASVTQLARLRLERQTGQVRLPLMFRVFLPFAGIVRPTVRRSGFQSAVNSADLRLVQAGLDQDLDAEQFVAVRLLYATVFPAIGIIFMLAGAGLSLTLGICLITYGLIFPTLWLTNQIRARHRSIQRSLPNVLDLLTLSVEAGRDFLTALKDILQHRPNDPLGDELERVFREVQLGKQRRDALKAMSNRVRQPDLTSAIDAMVQADELGISLGAILRILGDQMRAKRFHYAEKLANEAPTKLMLPLILFIFPAVIIIMLGPVLMQSLQQFY